MKKLQLNKIKISKLTDNELNDIKGMSDRSKTLNLLNCPWTCYINCLTGQDD